MSRDEVQLSSGRTERGCEAQSLWEEGKVVALDDELSPSLRLTAPPRTDHVLVRACPSTSPGTGWPRPSRPRCGVAVSRAPSSPDLRLALIAQPPSRTRSSQADARKLERVLTLSLYTLRSTIMGKKIVRTSSSSSLPSPFARATPRLTQPRPAARSSTSTSPSACTA